MEGSYKQFLQEKKDRLVAIKNLIRSVHPGGEISLSEVVTKCLDPERSANETRFSIETLFRASLVFVRRPIGTWTDDTAIAPLALRPEMTSREEIER